MSNSTILLTGATGLVGFRILQEALEKGYKLRLAVRSEARVAGVKAALSRNNISHSKIEFTLVPDMARKDAFNEAVRDVKYIIHVASPLPLPSDDLEASIIKPAVDVTMAVLYAALAAEKHTIEKIVITSSVAAVSPTVPKTFDADNVEPSPPGPYPNPFVAYASSKKIAYNATREFVAKEQPYFSVINIMPSFVIGRNSFATTKEEYRSGSNNIALAPLLGVTFPQPRPGHACHVDDVAAVHVAALSSDINGHRNFGVNYDGLNGVEWNNAIDIVKRNAPELEQTGVFPFGGSVVSLKAAFDASKTEAELGIKFKSFETMVLDVARAYTQIAA
jgi:nucleoside-diphosphate-sugar epimerase